MSALTWLRQTIRPTRSTSHTSPQCMPRQPFLELRSMIDDARVADPDGLVDQAHLATEDEHSMRVLEWILAAVALVAGIGLAFLR